jgi:hypothetical protein
METKLLNELHLRAAVVQDSQVSCGRSAGHPRVICMPHPQDSPYVLHSHAA